MFTSASQAAAILAAISISLGGLVGATPVAVAEASPTWAIAAPSDGLAKRGPNEALYFVNCDVQSGSTFRQTSEMVYYSNGKTGSQHGEQPNDVADFGQIIRWEGQAQTGRFKGSGGTATSNIRADAQSQSITTGTQVGTARNSFGQNFNCFKDNYRLLYSNQNAGTTLSCKSIYYCFDA